MAGVAAIVAGVAGVRDVVVEVGAGAHERLFRTVQRYTLFTWKRTTTYPACGNCYDDRKRPL